ASNSRTSPGSAASRAAWRFAPAGTRVCAWTDEASSERTKTKAARIMFPLPIDVRWSRRQLDDTAAAGRLASSAALRGGSRPEIADWRRKSVEAATGIETRLMALEDRRRS